MSLKSGINGTLGGGGGCFGAFLAVSLALGCSDCDSSTVVVTCGSLGVCGLVGVREAV